MKVTNRILKEKLKISIESSTPNVLPGVLQYMENGKNRNENILDTNTYSKPVLRKKKKNRFSKNLTLRLASLALSLMMVFGIRKTYGYLLTESIINFDVNPSLELKVNSFEKVLRVNPLNENARLVIGDMKLKNIDLDIAVNALIGSMVKNGYISSSNNSILISVDSSKEEKGTKLQQQLLEDINTFLNQYEVEGAVLSQKIEDKTTIKEIAKKHSISTGKASLIQSFVSMDNEKQFEEMAILSINDLNLLIEDKYANIQGVSKLGTANDIYIGKERAREIVLAHEDVEKDKIQSLEVERDFEKGRMIYRAKFNTNNTHYKYNIDAISGKILEIEKETIADSSEPECPPEDKPDIEVKYIGRTKAKDIALNHSGLKEDQVKDLKIELEKEKDTMVYDVEFKYSDFEFEYEINAVSGSILKAEKKTKSNPTKPENPEAEKPDDKQYIGLSKAKDIALNHAELKEDQVRDLKIEFEKEKDIMVYEVEFKTDTTKYEYDIHAINGKILEIEKKLIKPPKEPENPDKEQPSEADLDKAERIALNHAGLKKNQVSQLKVEQKNEINLIFYQVKFFSSGYKYKYEIDAKTGEILKSEKEKI